MFKKVRSPALLRVEALRRVNAKLMYRLCTARERWLVGRSLGEGRRPFSTSCQTLGGSMANTTLIYQKPTCSTCRQVIKLAQASGKPFQAINYYEQPFTKAKLKSLLKKAGLKATAIIRTKEDVYKKLKSKITTVSEDELIDIMLKHPDLIQRPLVEKGERAILARPAEQIKTIL